MAIIKYPENSFGKIIGDQPLKFDLIRAQNSNWMLKGKIRFLLIIRLSNDLVETFEKSKM